MNQGKNIGHYNILKPLGNGGMGEVYLAEDTKLKREVALKFLPEAVRSDPESLRRFRVEAEAAAKLNHPNIATIYSIEEADDQTFIAMEYVDGKTLSEHIPSDGLDIDQFFDWFLPLTNALAHAHEHGRIHRDLKPGNIMIASNGTPKILDFGLARIERQGQDLSELDSDAPTMTMKAVERDMPPSLTQGRSFLGTPAYMSPEQIEGKKVDARTDLFSFGVVMYEAMTGQRPFKGDNIESIIGRILTEEPASITSLKPVTPYTLWVCIRQCLKKDRKHRMQTAQQLYPTLKDVRQEVQAGTVLVDANMIPSEPPSESDSISVWRQPVGITAITVLALIIGILGSWLLRPMSNSPLRKLSLTIEAILTPLDAPVLSPDGTMVAYTESPAGPLWVRDLTHTESRVLSGTEGAERPFWSPDSRQIGYIQNATKRSKLLLRTVPAQGGPTTPVYMFRERTFPRGAAWMPNGRIVFSVVSLGQIALPGAGILYTISAGGGEPEIFLEPDSTRGEVGFVYPLVLPDGKTTVVSLTTTDGSGTLVTVAGDTRTELVRHPEAVLGFTAYSPSGHLVYQRDGGAFSDAVASIWALPVDVSSGRPTSEAFLIAEAQQIPSVSVDGTMLYSSSVTGGLAGNTLVWADREGTVLDTIGHHSGGIIDVAVSHDDKTVAATVLGRNIDIWIHDTEQHTSRRLTFDPSMDGGPTWSPTGARIAFYSGRGESSSGIYVQPADGRGTAEQVVSDAGIGPTEWSRDGRFLIYQTVNRANSRDNMDIHYLSLIGKRVPVPIVATPSDERRPALSYNGRYLAYVSDASGREEVFVTSFPSGEGRWQVSVNGGDRPRWSGQGDEMFYIESDKLMVIPVKTTSIFESGTPQVLIADGFHLTANGSDYGVSNDGQRFVMMYKERSDAESAITVVENWQREFEGQK